MFDKKQTISEIEKRIGEYNSLIDQCRFEIEIRKSKDEPYNDILMKIKSSENSILYANAKKREYEEDKGSEN